MKDLPKPEERVEIILNKDGDLVAAATYGPYTFTEPLPEGFGEWSEVAQRNFLKRKIVPKLFYLMKKAKANTILQDKRYN